MSASATTADALPLDHKRPISDLAANNPFSAAPPYQQQQQSCYSSPSASLYSPPYAGQAGSSSAPSRSPSSATARSATEKQRSKTPEALSLFPPSATASSSRAGTPTIPAPPKRAHQPRVNEALHAGSGGPRSSSRASVATTQGSEDGADEAAPPPSYVAAVGGANARTPAPGVSHSGRRVDMGRTAAVGGPWKPTTTTPLHMLDEREAVVDCPHCGHRGMSQIKKHNSKYTCLAGLGLGAVCFVLAVVPCLTHCMADTDHECSRCGRELARKRYRGETQVLAAVPLGARGGDPGGYVPMGGMQQRM